MKFFSTLALFLATTSFSFAATGRTFAGSAQSLAINGAACPEVLGWSGGEAFAPVVLEPAATGASAKKHLGAVGYEPIVVETGLPLSPALLECIADLCASRVTPRTLLLSTLSFNGEATTLQAGNAVLTEVRFPALDGASKDALRVTLVFQTDGTLSAKPMPDVDAEAGKPRKAALASNFRITLPGLPTARIARIEAFTLRRAVADNSVGKARNLASSAPATVVPDFTFLIGEADLADWAAWRDSFLLKGDNTDAAEKAGTLEILSADMKTPLFTLKLANVGLFRLSHPPVEAEKIRRFQTDLYCEALSVAVDAPKSPAKDAGR